MCNCSEHESGGSLAKMTGASVESALKPLVPLSRQISFTEEESGGQPAATDLQPFPPFKLCKLDFREGCYQINFRPTAGFVSFEGTLRVDRSAPDGGADHLIVSGDLYSKRPVIGPIPPLPPIPVPVPIPIPPVPPVGNRDEDEAAADAGLTSIAASLSAVDEPLIPFPIRRPRIPIFPRARYHSYLRVTSVSAPIAVPLPKKCELTIVAEQFNYTQPPAGQFKGSFPSTPSRTVTMKLSKVPAPFPFSLTGGPFYEGRLFEGGVDKGSVTLAWVSKFFRRCTLEIDTLVGAVRPAPVPDGAGGTEFFDTIFAKTGWQLSVVQDQQNVPVPPAPSGTGAGLTAPTSVSISSVQRRKNFDTQASVTLPLSTPPSNRRPS